MDALTNFYEKPSASNKVFLMKKLFNLKILEGGSIEDHLNEFHGIVDKLFSVGINFEYEIRALLLSYSLSYKHG